MNKFYITTTLPYVNSAPHIGFALEIVQADAIARFQRLAGKEVFFNTGTDEHGLKIFRKAEAEGKTAQEFCDELAARFDDLKGLLNLSYDKFIRTTDADHKAAAQEFWKRCLANDDIYKKNYSVKYCVGCELEKTDSELEEGKCPIHPTMDIELINEENYFFKFSKYQDQLLKLYEEQEDFVLPVHRQTEIKKFTERGLEDFSISRIKEKMPWGVPVPDDEDHVMYVWFDALVNYISTLGWPNDEVNFNEWWPGVQIAGKDNLRQQSNMWQGMLMSAGLPPSKQILIHGFITSEGKKMSKSVGNVVDPFEVVEKYGADAVRYYLLREIPTAEDGDFNEERFEVLYKDELQNTIGNLARRVMAMTVKYLDGNVPEGSDELDVIPAWATYEANMESFNIKKAIEAVIELARAANAYVEQNKPWELAKTDEARLAVVLGNLINVIRNVGMMLQAIIPETAEKLLAQLGETKIEMGDQLFPAIE